MTISDTLTARLISTARTQPVASKAGAANAGAAANAATQANSVVSLSSQAAVASMKEAILSTVGAGGSSVVAASDAVNELTWLLSSGGVGSNSGLSPSVGAATAQASVPNEIIAGTVAYTDPGSNASTGAGTYTASGSVSHPISHPFKAYA